MHQKKIYNLFKKKPSVFRNTELIFNNDLANYIESLGYKGIITEGADRVLEWRSPNFLYYPKNTKKIKLLLKNYKLSDDIAFRFSQQSWSEWPLDVKKYCQWVNSINGNGNLVNLFMDYETFGEHQWKDTGIFEFIKHLPEEFLKNPDNNFVTPSEAIKKYDAVAELDIPHYISWADLERDTSAWNGNSMQQSALKSAYKIEKLVLSTGNKNLIDSWRKLQTSDHFYYMCTKWYSDGDIHKYFNPYESPYDAYISFMNVLKDIKIRAYNDLRSRKSNVYKQNSTILNKEAITQS